MAMIEAHVDVQAPLDLVYEQWTRFARMLNLVDMQVKDDLLRFKDLVE